MRGGKRVDSGRKPIGNNRIKVIVDDKTVKNLNDTFEGNSQSEKIRNCIKYGICNKKGLSIASVFSGVGAFEHALQRLKINTDIIFACDNGDVNIFSKKMNFNFKSIDSEILELRRLIESILPNNSNTYVSKLSTRLESIESEYNDLKNIVNNIDLNDSLIKMIDSILESLSSDLTDKTLKYVDGSIDDISDYYLLACDFKKIIKKQSEFRYLIDPLDNLKKDKHFKSCIGQLKNLTKSISQLHETIGTLKVSAELSNIEDPREKKSYVDRLYKKHEKSNYVKKMYVDNYNIDPDHFHWNVSFLDASEYKDSVDLYVGGSPCQSFSMVGNRGGFEDTRGTLFYEYIRVLKELSPRFFIYENVKGVLSHDDGNTWSIMKNSFNETGYYFNPDPMIMNAKDFGVPQNRERIFVVGFKYKEDFEKFKAPIKMTLDSTMKDFLEDFVDEKYYLPEKGISFVTDKKNIDKKYTQINGDVALCQKANQQFNWHGDFIESYTQEELYNMSKIDEKYFISKKVKDYILDKSFYMNNKEDEKLIDLDIARPLTSTMHKMHRAGVDNYISYGKSLKAYDRRIRKLTPRECFRLMGFCDSFNLTVSDTQLYKQAGNSIVVDVIMAIIKEILKVY